MLGGHAAPRLSSAPHPKSLLPNSCALSHRIRRENWPLPDLWPHGQLTAAHQSGGAMCIQREGSKAQHPCCPLLAPGWERRILSSFPRQGKAVPERVPVCGCNNPRSHWETGGSQREQERRKMPIEPIHLSGSDHLLLFLFVSQMGEE